MAITRLDCPKTEETRPELAGVAKKLADRLYGPDGPPLGTAFSELENQALLLAGYLRKSFLDLLLERQAQAFLRDSPESLCLCPTCQRPTTAKDPEPRVLHSRAASVDWCEPHRYCSKCRRSFFPQSRGLGIDLGPYSSSLLGLICYSGANKPSFREASTDLREIAQIDVHEKQIERLCKRIGQERIAERDHEVATFLDLPLTQRKDGIPEGVTAPAQGKVAVVMADAGTLQLRDETWSTEATGGQTADGADSQEQEVPDEEDFDCGEKPSGRYWHEQKTGLVLVMKGTPSKTDPCPDIPETFVDAERVGKIVRGLKKSAALRAEDEQPQASEGDDSGNDEGGDEGGDSDEAEKVSERIDYEGPKVEQRRVVASRQSWPVFGAILACAAYQAGFNGAKVRGFVADGAKAIWGVWQSRFSAYVPILDFIHAMSYVYEAAKAVGKDPGEGWRRYALWITWVWRGEVGRVIEELQGWQEEHGGWQEDEPLTSKRNVVARTVGYLQNNRERMKYDEYRKQGLPVVSSLVESMVKQVSRRVKGTEKFWGEEGAEAILQLRADYLSDGDVMGDFWQRREAAQTGQRFYRSRT